MTRTLAFALCVVSCASVPQRVIGVWQQGDPAWPNAADARVRYVGELRDPENLGIVPSGWARFWRAITGNQRDGALFRPVAVAVGPSGAIAVADIGSGSVHVYVPASKQHRFLTEGIAAPVNVAFAADGRLFVADGDLRRVSVFPPDRDVPSEHIEGFVRPTGLALSRDNKTLYVADTPVHTVWALALDGGSDRRAIGGRGEALGRLNFPTHLAVDIQDRLLVTDAMNFGVQIFDHTGVPRGRMGQLGDGPGDLARPKGIATDAAGRVYVVDGQMDVVQVFDATGSLLFVFGGTGTDPGRFWLANGVAIDAAGRLLVADTYNARVQAFEVRPPSSLSLGVAR